MAAKALMTVEEFVKMNTAENEAYELVDASAGEFLDLTLARPGIQHA
jgi:hypothetical protein